MHHDPLLNDDDAMEHGGLRTRGPIGNSARTLLLFGALVLIGISIWWIRRPSDLTDDLGARQWVVVEVDGERALTPGGTVSAFVLDGTGEARLMDGCRTAIGTWEFDVETGELRVDAAPDDSVDCTGELDTHAPSSGPVDLDGSRLVVHGETSVVGAIALGDLPIASATDLAGRWDAGGSTVEFGERGLLRIDECEGSWSATGGGIVANIDDADPVCDLEPIWVSGDVLLPVVVDDGLFIRRDVAAFPVDRDIRWFTALPERDSPLLDGA